MINHSGLLVKANVKYLKNIIHLQPHSVSLWSLWRSVARENVGVYYIN